MKFVFVSVLFFFSFWLHGTEERLSSVPELKYTDHQHMTIKKRKRKYEKRNDVRKGAFLALEYHPRL